MSDNLHPTIVSEMKFSGASFQVVDYHWNAGTEILECDPEVVLRWRMHPYRIKARDWDAPDEEVRFGRLMLHPAGAPTHARAYDDQENVRTLVCRYDRDWLSEATGTDVDWSDGTVAPNLDLRNGDLDYGMRRLLQELLEPGLASRTLIEGLSVSIAADIVRALELDGGRDQESRGVLSAKRLRHVHDYIESFTEGCPDLSDVAVECGISVAHLRRLYKSTTGRTLHDFIEEVRVKRAKELLLDTNLPLKVISYKLGFCHPSAFSFAFKKLTGEPPRAFRLRST